MNEQEFVQEAGGVPVAVNRFIGVSMADAPLPIPEKVLVSWKTADGKSHEQTVEVSSRIPDIHRFQGSIYYKFTDSGVPSSRIPTIIKNRMSGAAVRPFRYHCRKF